MKDDDRLYPIRVPNWFLGGWVGDRAQVLIANAGDRLMCVWFHADGRLDRVDEVPLADPPADFDARQRWYEERVTDWMRARHVTPGLLRVREFWVNEPLMLGIGRYPRWMEEVLEEEQEPLPPGAEESPAWRRRRKLVDEWDADGGFVLYCGGSEYWLNHTGEVQST